MGAERHGRVSRYALDDNSGQATRRLNTWCVPGGIRGMTRIALCETKSSIPALDTSHETISRHRSGAGPTTTAIDRVKR
jgi:hypothetical protein